MVIQTYFNQIKAGVDRYASTPFVLDAKLNFDLRPGEQGYLNGSIQFVDETTLHFKEFVDALNNSLEKVKYSYHYQEKENLLVFRYDNARHKPQLLFSEHKHLSGQIIEASAPTLGDVLFEIFNLKGWGK